MEKETPFRTAHGIIARIELRKRATRPQIADLRAALDQMEDARKEKADFIEMALERAEYILSGDPDNVRALQAVKAARKENKKGRAD